MYMVFVADAYHNSCKLHKDVESASVLAHEPAKPLAGIVFALYESCRCKHAHV